MGAPPTDTPGEPKVLVLCPVVVVPPRGVDCPKVLPELGSVPPVVEFELPVLPNGEDPVPLVGEDGEEPKGELLLLEEDPKDELPNDDPEDEPNEEELLVVPVVVLEAPVGVMPFVFCMGWPNKPIGPTLASPR